MIVEEPHGLAEHDDERPFGCPYHGLVTGGEVELPNGQTRSYPQPSGGIPFAGRSLLLAPPWAPGGEQSSEDAAAGREWQDYALIAGDSCSIHGQDLGYNCWLWAESEGRVWRVEPLDDLIRYESPGTCRFKLTRFGWFGEPPDGELERTVEITVPVNYPPDNGYGHAYPLEYGTDPGASAVLADITSDGSRAMFVSAMRWRTKGGFALLAAFEINLYAGTASIAYLQDTARQEEVSKTASYGSIVEPVQVSTRTVSCSEGTSLIGRNEYQQTDQLEVGENRSYNSIDEVLLAAGYSGSQASLVTSVYELSSSTTVTASVDSGGYSEGKIEGDCDFTGTSTLEATQSLSVRYVYTTKVSIRSNTAGALLEVEAVNDSTDRYTEDPIYSGTSYPIDYWSNVDPDSTTTESEGGYVSRLIRDGVAIGVYRDNAVMELFDTHLCMASSPNTVITGEYLDRPDTEALTVQAGKVRHVSGVAGPVDPIIFKIADYAPYASIHPVTGEAAASIDGPVCWV